MNILGIVAYAYASESQLGSCFTAPVRGYVRWFAQPIQNSKGYCAQVGRKVAHVVSAIFAYLVLAIPTAVGILINLFAPLPTDLTLIVRKDAPTLTASSKGGYSLWAINVGLPEATQYFLNQLKIILNARMNFRGTNSLGCTYALGKVITQYTYKKGALLAYVLYDPSLENSSLPATISGERKLQLVHFSDSQLSASQLDLMPGVPQSLVMVPENGFPTFDEQCEQLNQWLDLCSARLNWIPERYDIRCHNGYTLVAISIPDQLIPRAQEAYPNGHLRLDGAPPPLLLQLARVTT